MMKKVVSIFFFTICYFHCLPQETNTENSKKIIEKFNIEASYIGDIASNLYGGLNTGICYLGMLNLRLSIVSENLGLWNGAELGVYATNTHGASPSSLFYGDIQVVSNIDAGNHTYLQEFWIKQTLGTNEFTIGLQDLNIEFANSEYGSLFLNSSFGILPIISGNITPPIFPLTALGFTVKSKLSKNIKWVNALYDGSPTDFDYNPYNVKWQFISGDGLLAISEFQYCFKNNELPGCYKMGVYSHSHIIEKSLGKYIPDSLSYSLFGIYAYADQNIWNSENKSLGIFTQLGYSPSEKSINDFYIGFGINYEGLFSKHGCDILGLAIAYEHLADQSKHETAIELSYQYILSNYLFIQPDFQFIINPSGTEQKLNNSLAAILRFGVNF